jgi:peptidyl-prolyl cis-trans isomerase SurA
MKTVSFPATLICLGAVLVSILPAAETVERIAAVVGDRAILASELASQVQMVMIQAGPDTKLDPKELAKDILRDMVNDELILSAARDDTTITASPEEVKSALDEHIASLVSRFPSEDEFLAQLSREGFTKRSYEKRLSAQIKDQVLKQKIISKRLSSVTVSRQEVEGFYKQYRDSLPEISPRVRLAHILISFEPSPKTEDSLRQLAEKAREMAVQGTDFADVAGQFGSGVVGGRIGRISREDLVPEFARAAFSLQPGTVSGPVRTEYGWHIIKSHGRSGDTVDVSQILFPVVASAVDSARAKTLVDSIYQALQGGADFRETAKAYSDDDSTRGVGGEMETMDESQLRPEFVAAIDAVQPGQITTPVESQLGYHILRLLDRTPGRPLDMEQDFDIIRNMARQQKVAQMVSKWVDDLKKKVYVDIRNVDIVK